jgi:aminoglycoside phosphotransferase (APT) family kinase protein
MKANNLLRSDMLARCLKDTLPNDAIIVSVNNIRRFSEQGTTAVMYFFTLAYFSRGSEHRKEFVLRIYKEGLEKTGQKEVILLKRLKMHDLPVPSVYCFEPNKGVIKNAFLIMEKISGTTAAHSLDTESEGKIIVEKMAENLVKVHKFDPNCLENFEALRKQFELQKSRALKIQFFVKKHCMSFLGFCPYRQRKFIAAVKRLEDLTPEKHRQALLHLDYGPDHIIVSNGQFIIVDWGQAAVGDPAYDVAWTYHKLRLGRENSRIDLEKHFVTSYERYMGERLVNLQFYKDIVAIEIAFRFFCCPFNASNLHNYAKLVDLSFGNIIGRLLSERPVRRLRKILENHHTEIWKDIEYIQNYAIRYLERDKYN